MKDIDFLLDAKILTLKEIASGGVPQYKMKELLEKLNLPTTCTADAARVMRAVSHDKKRAGDAVNAVLVNEVGTFEQRALTLDELRARYEACFGEGQA